MIANPETPLASNDNQSPSYVTALEPWLISLREQGWFSDPRHEVMMRQTIALMGTDRQYYVDGLHQVVLQLQGR